MPGIGLDIDNPHELELLVQRDGRHPCPAPAALLGHRITQPRSLGSGRLMPSRLAPESTGTPELHAIPVWGIGDVLPGDSIADLVVDALAARRTSPARRRHSRGQAQDRLQGGRPHGRARDGEAVAQPAKRFAAKNGVDARVIELALREAKRVVRQQHVLITETSHGLVCANSGIDVSNVDGGKTAVLLPLDPDRSAARIHRQIKKRTTLHVPVIIADSFGRAWREGLNEVAIGVAGMKPMHDYRGQRRCLWLQNARHRGVCCRRTGLRGGPGLRKEYPRSGLYNSWLSLSSRERQRAADRPSRGQRFVPLSISACAG